MTMVAFELFAIAHNLNAELSTLGITSKEAENDSSLYDHLIVNESLREKTRELYFDGHYTRVIEEAFKLIDNLVKEKASIAPSSSLTGSKLMQMAFSERDLSFGSIKARQLLKLTSSLDTCNCSPDA